MVAVIIKYYAPVTVCGCTAIRAFSGLVTNIPCHDISPLLDKTERTSGKIQIRTLPAAEDVMRSVLSASIGDRYAARRLLTAVSIERSPPRGEPRRAVNLFRTDRIGSLRL